MRALGFLLLSLGCWAQKIPRLRFTLPDSPALSFEDGEKPAAISHDPGSEQLYVGGRGAVHVLTFTEAEVNQTRVVLPAEEKALKDCKSQPGAQQAECENFIRVIQRLNSSSIIVCGTNAGSPRCWFLTNDMKLQQNKLGQLISINGENLSPAWPSQPAATIAVEGNLYSALSQQKSTIQRSYGPKKLLRTEDKWLANTEFISAALLPQKEKTLDEIFFFYNEVNKMAGLDEEPVKAQIGRVCKVDEGGKTLLVDSWSTFLKARLVCGHPADPQRFHRLRDAFVLSEGQQGGGMLYGIFSSAWGTTAICTYSMDRVNQIFRTSKLKGYSSVMPAHRPGTCVPYSSPNAPSKATLSIIKEYPEIEQVIYPEGQRPLYMLQTNDTYTQVVADRVLDASNASHTVLYLGTDKGKIHKVLQGEGQTVIIAEMSPFRREAPISGLILDASTGYLYASTEFEVTRLPLADCGQYRETCWKCVLARDPYCGWDLENKRCSAVFQEANATTSSFLQSLHPEAGDVCEGVADQVAQEALKKVSVDPTSYIYLPCPLRSHHAIYTWVKDGAKQYPCDMDGHSCTLRFGENAPMDQGVFKCTATEEGYKEEITVYKLTLNSATVPQLPLMMLFLTIAILLC
ncbi:semaphorin-7A isoform B [Alligator mississippiensis]|uniref:Semaphorin-7A isoform B n=1 Tax=Alligator mississippiensis TaxID=8496 RepID=A0A151M5D2_ALLMI|nr:semaphorin-7A isoform B [Alligator mississippiensis]